MFESKGTFIVPAGAVEEDQLMETALEGGADDVQLDQDTYEVTCQPSEFTQVKQALAEADVTVETSEVQKVPSNTIAVDGDSAKKVLNLMEALEDHDDVQKVWANFDITDEVMASME
jgi:transcriptional/translational regulatory protein YebC/TACO1